MRIASAGTGGLLVQSVGIANHLRGKQIQLAGSRTDGFVRGGISETLDMIESTEVPFKSPRSR